MKFKYKQRPEVQNTKGKESLVWMTKLVRARFVFAFFICLY